MLDLCRRTALWGASLALLLVAACGGPAVPKATGCAAGTQDNDNNGTCEPTCETANLGCVKGTCSDASGTAQCVCDNGFTGAKCEGCAAGTQDNDKNGTCSPTCETANLGCVKGACSDASGTAQCVCDRSHAGEKCDTCAEGYQDNDNNGTCEPTCTTADLACANGGTCSDASGKATCECPMGYSGALCGVCAPGYQDNDTNGSCTAECTITELGCVNGACDDSSGTTLCACAPGYTGDLCDACAEGYQDYDDNGTCEPTCDTANLGCVNGTCDDSDGTAICECDDGYAGATCSSCATGYQDNDTDGSCEMTCELMNLGCGHGACTDASGTVLCACAPGYAGEYCDSCAAGFQDNDGNDTCAPDCTTANLACVNGACDDSSGAAACACSAHATGALCDTCRPGYAGGACDTCAAGYQDNDGNGTWELSCAAANLTCANGGTCSDANGTAHCECTGHFGGALCNSCATGYTGASCNSCATGYQDNDNNGTCEESCAIGCPTGSLSCTDTSGTAVCTLPQTCADVKAHTPTAADGTYVLFYQGARESAWNAWCANMATTPAEFLTLQQTGANQNYALYKGGGWVQYIDVTTSYQRVRINPTTLVVDTDDRTYATSSGDNNGLTWMAYGTAGNCSWMAPGTGNVDLRGTRFVVSGPFCVNGWAPWGSATVSPTSDQVVDLVGSGQCGDISPRVSSCSDAADPDGWNMQLALKACPTGRTGPDCSECKHGLVPAADGTCQAP